MHVYACMCVFVHLNVEEREREKKKEGEKERGRKKNAKYKSRFPSVKEIFAREGNVFNQVLGR